MFIINLEKEKEKIFREEKRLHDNER